MKNLWLIPIGFIFAISFFNTFLDEDDSVIYTTHLKEPLVGVWRETSFESPRTIYISKNRILSYDVHSVKTKYSEGLPYSWQINTSEYGNQGVDAYIDWESGILTLREYQIEDGRYKDIYHYYTATKYIRIRDL
jgi:hypothetical protein